jgi:hypothetical protein
MAVSLVALVAYNPHHESLFFLRYIFLSKNLMEAMEKLARLPRAYATGSPLSPCYLFILQRHLNLSN